MPQGKVEVVPEDGLTTRQRRNRPLLAVHTGQMKGKSTAAFGMAMRAWNQGWSIAVYQFVKSAKWKVGEENALTALGRLHEQTGEGGPVVWHKMGSGWSWSRRQGTEVDHAADAGVLLVGDLPYFRRFGFRPAPDVRLAGPVDQGRVLWCGQGEPVGAVLPA